MQYFKKYSNSSLTRDKSVIKLNRILQICAERAKNLYTCKISFDIPSTNMFAEIPAEDIIKHIFFIIEKHCASEKSLTIKLAQNASAEKAYISFVSEKTILNTIEIELYTGTPEVVIREPDKDYIIKLVDSFVFKMRACSK